MRALLRGLALRCPACARGRLSRGALAFTRFHDACAACGLAFEKTRGEFTGAMMFGQGLLGAVGLGSYFLAFGFAPVPLATQLAWVAAFGLALPLVAYRHLKGAWVGTLYAIDPWDAPPAEAAPAMLPQESDALVYDGWSAFDAGRRAEARRLAEEVLARRPGDHDALLLMHALRDAEPDDA